MKAICDYCGKNFEAQTGHYNRAKKLGNNVYCDRVHAGLGRRKNKSVKEKKKDKSDYDKQYRIKNFEKIRLARIEYFKKDYSANPGKYKAIRQSIYQKHLKYLSTPEYKKWKQNYDLKHRAKKFYGEFAEAAIILFEIEKIVDSRLAKSDAGLINKSKKRKKLCNSKNKNYQPLI